MAQLDAKVRKELEEIFKGLKNEVILKFFTQVHECRFCSTTHALIKEISELSDKIKLQIFEFIKDKVEADKYGVDKIPAIVVMDNEDYGIKFYGIPSGYEFGSIIEAIRLVSTGESPLQAETMKFLDTLEKDIHLQVFVTPNCPYCPQSVILAHQMAYYSKKVKADMIEATEFPHLTHKYNVMGVPRTVINETEYQEGAAPEGMIIQKIKSIL